MKKQFIARLAAICILLGGSFCFLYPSVPRDLPVIQPAEPAALQLHGDGTALIEAELVGVGTRPDSTPGTIMDLRLNSSDDRYYMLGDYSWASGTRSKEGQIGYVERLDADGWDRYCSIKLTVPSSPRYVICPESFAGFNDTPFNLGMLLEDAGTYRIHLFAKEFYPTSFAPDKSAIGDTDDTTTYSFYFDYTVAEEKCGSETYMLYSDLRQDRTRGDDARYDLSISFYSESNIKCVQPASISIVPVSRKANKAQPVIDARDYLSRQHDSWVTMSQYEVYERFYGGNMYAFNISLINCERDTEYLLKLTVSENADGSGKQADLRIILRF